MRVTWIAPTHPRKKLTVARLGKVSNSLDVDRGGNGVQNVPGLDDQTPACPNCAGGGECCVLGKGERVSWAREVGDAGEDESPLID